MRQGGHQAGHWPTFLVDAAVTGGAAERAHHAADWQAVLGRPAEDHDDLHDRGAQPRRGRQADRAEGGELAGVHVAVAAASSLGRQGARLLRQHLRRAVPLLARVSRQHAATRHHAAHRQVTRALASDARAPFFKSYQNLTGRVW